MYDRLKGVLPEPIGEGTHIRIPWLQNPTIMDIRTRPRSISSVTGTQGGYADSVIATTPHWDRPATMCLTKLLPSSLACHTALSLGSSHCVDLQMVNITLRVLSKPREEQLPTIFKVPLCHAIPVKHSGSPNHLHMVVMVELMIQQSIQVLQQAFMNPAWLVVQNLGTDWDERVLPSIGNEIVKAVVARYNAEQLLTQRDKVSKAVGTAASLCNAPHNTVPSPVHSIARYRSSFASVRSMQVRESLVERAKEFNIMLDDVAITHLSFGTEVRPHGSISMVSAEELAISLR
jgi:hypothetical protein